MCRMHANPQPLLDAARSNAQDGPSVIAVTCRSDDFRATPRHSHTRGQLIAANSGLLTIDTDQERLVVPPSHAIWVPPGHPHSLRSHGPFDGWSVYVAAAQVQLPARALVIQVSALLRAAVLRAAGWSAALQLEAAQARVLAVILDEIVALPGEKLALPLPTERRLKKIAQAIADDPADNRTLLQWAQWAAIAPRTLTRRFAAETGMPLSEWRQRARLLRALELLAAGKPVTSIALELGYDSLSAFIAMFRRALGVSPSKYLSEKAD
ncbi:helix-turn-helix domain-containing protein [Collimonas sp. PA-H2]|uniref:AraC family transcriptional regulator n=1 Tax=Collimonas sp. PA-H2 TaxID=1881062 RepID=UPI000BF8B236